MFTYMSIKALLKETHSPFKDHFFSQSNMDKISYIIRHKVYKNTGKKIPPLEKGQLLEVMAVYYQNRQAEDSVEIHRLNRAIIDKLSVDISSGVLDYDLYLKEQDVNNYEIELDNPISTVLKKNTPSSQVDILFGDLWNYTN